VVPIHRLDHYLHLGGLITQGAGKQGVGDPVKGQIVFLMDSDDEPLGYTYTDPTGYFRFLGIPLGEYEIWVDKPLVDNGIAPFITLNIDTPKRDNLSFKLHETWLELVEDSIDVSVKSIDILQSISIIPNPFNEGTSLIINLNEASEVSFKVYDLLGSEVLTVGKKLIKPGINNVEVILPDSAPGIYFLKVMVNEFQTTIRMVLY